MNRKGQLGIGAFIGIAITIIACLVLYQSAAGFVGAATTTGEVTNRSITAPALNGRLDLVGQELLNTPIVVNRSNRTDILTSGNYTIAETVSTVDGLKRISYVTLNSQYAGQVVNVSYQYAPEGYIDDSGGRSLALLIPLLGAVAIAIFALSSVYKDDLFI